MFRPLRAISTVAMDRPRSLSTSLESGAEPPIAARCMPAPPQRLERPHMQRRITPARLAAITPIRPATDRNLCYRRNGYEDACSRGDVGLVAGPSTRLSCRSPRPRGDHGTGGASHRDGRLHLFF